MAHAIFDRHQTSGTGAGMCVCGCTHQKEKTALQIVHQLGDINLNSQMDQL